MCDMQTQVSDRKFEVDDWKINTAQVTVLITNDFWKFSLYLRLVYRSLSDGLDWSL